MLLNVAVCASSTKNFYTRNYCCAKISLSSSYHIISNKHIKREKSKLFQNTIIKNRNAVDKAKEK